MSNLGEALKQLVTPVHYVRIKHPVKRYFDWVLPGVIAVGVLLFLLFSPASMPITGEGGIVHSVSELIKILIGFFIASLAAVATFQRESMDTLPDGDPITLWVKRKGKSVNSKLTRRMFLSYLFGYLSFLSILLYFVSVATPFVAANAAVFLEGCTYSLTRWGAILVYLFFTANLMTTALLGLHFMTDRIHR